MRRYQPTTLPTLADGVAPDEDVVLAESDSEDDEYAALMTAADLSAERLVGLPDGQRRRVVAVFDANGTVLRACTLTLPTTRTRTTTWRGTRRRRWTRSCVALSDNIPS